MVPDLEVFLSMESISPEKDTSSKIGYTKKIHKRHAGLMHEPMETAHLEICSEANAHWYTGTLAHTIRVSDNVAVNALGLMKCFLI